MFQVSPPGLWEAIFWGGEIAVGRAVSFRGRCWKCHHVVCRDIAQNHTLGHHTYGVADGTWWVGNSKYFVIGWVWCTQSRKLILPRAQIAAVISHNYNEVTHSVGRSCGWFVAVSRSAGIWSQWSEISRFLDPLKWSSTWLGIDTPSFLTSTINQCLDSAIWVRCQGKLEGASCLLCRS